MKKNLLRQIIKILQLIIKKVLDVFYFLRPVSSLFSFILHPSSFVLRRGQAMTEVVLLLPVFIIILVFIVKIFALLVLIQKMEIASYYAARRWQLQSHLNAAVSRRYDGALQQDILDKVKGYIGLKDPKVANFLNLKDVKISIQQTMVWNVVTLTVSTDPLPRVLRGMLCRYGKPEVCKAPYGKACEDGYDYLCTEDRELHVIKYVPNRDRPLQFELPGLD